MRLRNIAKVIDDRILGGTLARCQSAFSIGPSHISVDLSGDCNLACVMCSRKKHYPKGISNLSRSSFQRLRPSLLVARSLDLYSNCEPFLNPGAAEILRYAKETKESLYISVATNGVLLRPELSRALIDNGLDRISVSVDGANASTYEEIRIGARFTDVISNLSALVQLKKETGSQTPAVQIIFVAMKRNYRELCDLIDLAWSIGVDSIQVNGLEAYDEGMQTEALYGKQAPAEVKDVFRAARTLARERGISLALPSLARRSYKNCVLRRCYIDAAGNVFPCAGLSYERPYWYLGERRLHPRVSFGNIHARDLLEIWGTPEYRAFRKGLRQGNMPAGCSKCLMRHGVLCP